MTGGLVTEACPASDAFASTFLVRIPQPRIIRYAWPSSGRCAGGYVCEGGGAVMFQILLEIPGAILIQVWEACPAVPIPAG